MNQVEKFIQLLQAQRNDALNAAAASEARMHALQEELEAARKQIDELTADIAGSMILDPPGSSLENGADHAAAQ